MRLQPRQQRLIAWLASVVMLMAALWPSVSLALAARSGPDQAFVTLCSPGRASGQALSKGGSIKADGPASDAMASEHCAWCLLASSPLAPPPAPAQETRGPLPAPLAHLPSPDDHGLFAAEAWPGAIPRAPPFHAA